MRDRETVSKYQRFFRGNTDALALAMAVIRIADVWDDLVDRDEDVTESDINEAFVLALVELPRNPFYRAHMDELLPLMESGVLNWLTANRLEALGGERELEIANIIRHDIGDLFLHMARLIGGFGWATEIAPELKLLVQNDTLKQYLEK